MIITPKAFLFHQGDICLPTALKSDNNQTTISLIPSEACVNPDGSFGFTNNYSLTPKGVIPCSRNETISAIHNTNLKCAKCQEHLPNHTIVIWRFSNRNTPILKPPKSFDISHVRIECQPCFIESQTSKLLEATRLKKIPSNPSFFIGITIRPSETINFPPKRTLTYRSPFHHAMEEQKRIEIDLKQKLVALPEDAFEKAVRIPNGSSETIMISTSTGVEANTFISKNTPCVTCGKQFHDNESIFTSNCHHPYCSQCYSGLKSLPTPPKFCLECNQKLTHFYNAPAALIENSLNPQTRSTSILKSSTTTPHNNKRPRDESVPL